MKQAAVAKIIIMIALISAVKLHANQPEFIITEIFNETYENLQLRFNHETKLEIPAHQKITTSTTLPSISLTQSINEQTYVSQKGYDGIESIATITNDKDQTLFNIVYKQMERNLDTKRSTGKPETQVKIQLLSNHTDKSFWENTKQYIGLNNRYLIKLHFIQDAQQNIIPVHSWLNVEPQYN